MRAFMLLAVLVAVVGCNKGDASTGGGGSGEVGPADGTERGRCYGNRTCNDGLMCLSDLCVRPPGADCKAVAEKLAQQMLGNYAERSVRDAYIETTAAECHTAMLTKEEGACLMTANRNALASCPKVVGIGDCAKLVPHLDELQLAADPYLDNAARRLQARCKNEVPSKAFETCAMAARTIEEVERCRW